MKTLGGILKKLFFNKNKYLTRLKIKVPEFKNNLLDFNCLRNNTPLSNRRH